VFLIQGRCPDAQALYRQLRTVGAELVLEVVDLEEAERFFPADPPQFYSVPFSCHQIDPIKDLLIRATGLMALGLLLAMIVGCLFNSWLMDHTEGLLYAWLTGVLFAGLESPRKGESPLTDAT